MHVLIAIAFKSLLIAGLTLVLLALMKRRSAAEGCTCHTSQIFPSRSLNVLCVTFLRVVGLKDQACENPASKCGCFGKELMLRICSL